LKGFHRVMQVTYAIITISGFDPFVYIASSEKEDTTLLNQLKMFISDQEYLETDDFFYKQMMALDSLNSFVKFCDEQCFPLSLYVGNDFV